MKLNLAENFKRLRKKRGITQEELASFIGVSFQAVSKWERNEGYPDITFLPTIANFFDVSIDELLGMNEIKDNIRRNEMLQGLRKNSSEGNVEACISVLRECVRCFPDDYLIMSDLAMYLDGFGNTPEERNENHAQAIELYELTLKFCDDEKIRSKALSNMCLSLYRNGETDKARKCATDLPTMYDTEETVLPKILSGKERTEYCQQTIQKLAWLFWWLINRMVDGKDYSDADKIELFKKSIAFYEIVYEKEDYAFSHCRLSSLYESIAILFLKQGKVEEGLDNLEKCVDHAVAYDTLPDSMKLSSLLVNELEYDKQYTSRSSQENETRSLLDNILNDLKDERSLYHQCEQMDKFKQLIKKLKATAN